MQFSPCTVALLALVLAGPAAAQQAGTVVAEEHPPMPLEYCTKDAGCAAEPASVVMDSNWRWLHDANGYENCATDGKWSETFCPDGLACGANCALEGIDAEGYSKTYGVKSIPEGLELEFVAASGSVGSRVYMTDGSGEAYKMFKLKNREFSFDVDVNSLACGMNGALYFVEMDKVGGKGMGNNQAGAKFGTGYCDAQCPHARWVEGEANMDGYNGICCVEMDIWEANRMATAFTPHPCATEGPFKCSGTSCGDGAAGERYMGVCDKDGCDYNAYRMGAHSFYGVGADFAVDTSKPMTVVTQFLTSDGTDEGDLVEIRQLYVQDGKVIEHANSTIPGVQGNSITDDFCNAQKATFQDPDDHKAKGGLKSMGEALDRGMVLALSLWDDGSTEMRWLDSVFPADASATRPGVMRGPCDGSTSNPEYLRSTYASSTVTYTNIRHGEIGSTTSAGARRLGSIMV